MAVFAIHFHFFFFFFQFFFQLRFVSILTFSFVCLVVLWFFYFNRSLYIGQFFTIRFRFNFVSKPTKKTDEKRLFSLVFLHFCHFRVFSCSQFCLDICEFLLFFLFFFYFVCTESQTRCL